MRRRALLTFAGGALAGLAGCGTDTLGTDTPETTSTTEPVPATSPATSATTEPPTDDRLSVGLEFDQYLVRTFEIDPHVQEIPPNEIVPEDEIPRVLHDVLREALEDNFSTDDPDEALLNAIDEFRHVGIEYRFEPYVRLDGDSYVFDPTVPEFSASLELDVDDVDPDRTAHWEEDVDSEAVEAFVRTIAGTTPESPLDTYRMSVVPDAVQAFLDRYDYLETPLTTGRFETDYIDPGPPYTVAIRELTETDVWGREVVDASEMDSELRSFVTTAVNSDRRAPALDAGRTEYRTDELPSSYGKTLAARPNDEGGPFVRIDGTVYSLDVWSKGAEQYPIELAVDVRSDGTGRPAFAVTVTATDDGPAERRVGLESPGVLPSVLWARLGTERVRLETPNRDGLEWVDEAGDHRQIGNRAQRSLRIGKSLETTYEVPESLPDGAYHLWGLTFVSWDDIHWRGPPFPFQIVLDVETE